MTPNPIDLTGVPIRFSQFIQPGCGFVMGGALYYRHPTEFYLHAAQAKWHPSAGHCPTWDDAMECRCMLGGEA